MKLRSIAFAGAALCALGASPAMAYDPGFYMGLGVGYDHQEPVDADTLGNVHLKGRLATEDSAIGVLSFGYKWESAFRVEIEANYTEHDVQRRQDGAVGLFDGSTETRGAMVNALYDW